MEKTNSKVVRNRVIESLQNWNDCDLYAIQKQFKDEYSWAIRRYGLTNACIQWLRGLAINCDFYYDSIAITMAKWLGDTVENQEKWIEKKGDDLYWLLMAREIVRGLNV